MATRALAIRRINRDIKEITKNPIEGIGIAPIDEDPMRYVINMRLMTGPYQGYCVQLLLIFSDSYPTKPPKILIIPNQAIDEQYHHHIFIDENSRDENNSHFKKFCFDLLDNDFMNTSAEKTGWNPSYSITSLLLQVQNFIADPDMGGHVPNDNLIEQLMQSMDTYTRTFTITDENGHKVKKTHTWKEPYPEMYIKPKEEEKEKDKEKEILEKEQLENQIRENLTCFMLKVNYIDNPEILLGYPVIRNQLINRRNTRLELFPIPELLTYDGFQAQKSLQPQMINQYFGQFKSANNEYYNNWLPIYINEAHYQKNKDRILKSIAEITSNEVFDPEQIFIVLPAILNSMIIGISRGKAALSSSFIKCYFQFILLFKKMCQEFNVQYSVYLNDIFNKIKDNNFSVDKQIIPDIGNFFMVLLFNKMELNSDTLKKINNALFEDFVVRQMFWMFHSDETRYNMKRIILSDVVNKSFLEEFETNKNFKMNNLKKFVDDLKAKNIYQSVIEIIQNDKGYLDGVFIGKESAKKQVEILINQSFKGLFQRCSKEGKEKLREIILKNLNFQEYFGYLLTKDGETYDNFQVHELLKTLSDNKKNEFLETAFKSQKGNYLLLITFFAQKKIEEKGFLEQLEKNYGVYLDVDNFIKDMNQKISEIKTYKQLFEYIGADFIKEDKYKDKDDLGLIIDSYQKALEKKYINPKPKGINSLSQSQLQSQNNLIINNGMIPNIPMNPFIIQPVQMPMLINNNNNFNNFHNNQNNVRNVDRDRFRNRDRNRNRNRNRNRDRDRNIDRDRNRHRRNRRSRSRSRSRSDSRSDSRSYGSSRSY